MALIMSFQPSFLQRFRMVAAGLAVAVSTSGVASAQALSIEVLRQGTVLVHVALPMTDATSVAWSPGGGGSAATGSEVAGSLTLVADLEAALSGLDASPRVVVAVGGAPLEDIRRLLERVLVGPPAGAGGTGWRARPGPLHEGGVERRLGPPGADTVLQLVVALPAADDWRRSDVEVLWDLVPELLAGDLPQVVTRVEDGRGVLEMRVEPELADLKLASVRLQLARLAGDPRLEPELVDAARSRLRVRRLARLEVHPDGAEALLGRWLEGGGDAVREYLFGLDGVTVTDVRTTARQWLPLHPGSASVLLPPRVFSPRFASGPRQQRLDNDLSVAVLERPTTPLSALCLRPVLLPDVDGQVAATVLARVAAELRTLPQRPGWVHVATGPTRLELAADPERFAELLEALHLALERIADDERSPTATSGDPRRRALELMAGLLGLEVGEGPSPAELLRPDNLGLGMVVPDGEAASEAVSKFLVAGWGRRSAPASRPLAASQRRREAVPGDRSVVAAVADLPLDAPEAATAVALELLDRRLRSALPERTVSLLRPLIPGRRVLVVLVEGQGALDRLETDVGAAWARSRSAPGDDELAPVRRRVAASRAAEAGGVVGRACACAAVASGIASWRTASEEEMEILTLGADEVGTLLRGLPAWDALSRTGAGVLPISGGAVPRSP